MAPASCHHSTTCAFNRSTEKGLTHPELVATASKLLEDEEQYRAKPYMCSERYPTVGFGQRIGPRDAPLSVYRFTLPRPVAETWLRINVALLAGQLVTHPTIAPAFAAANLARQTILLSMAYQLGVNGLARFENTLKAAASGDWRAAARHALDSRWARQTPQRAKRHAMALERGELVGAMTLTANAGEQR
ncbi:glycoside hydrolase family protein [Shewanella sp. 3B26]|uniref:Glycoside hydrolase family protein n=1 Tax=Shewanella zhuhaiensis TaxID=2919576 RepID=A0AAJ1BJ13_9GAMM|nr:glycoside hydrolase family protein [Shewanella zhuhaiensis]MCH4295591.1 glycoside hydrolase family protein [Shewanella zhuhaiensis]